MRGPPLSLIHILKAVRDGMAGEEAKEGYVYIHDGARPFVDEEIIKRAYTCVEENRACVAGMPSKDTVKICLLYTSRCV